MAHNHTLDGGISRLSISEGVNHPNLTSRTPPPPGFDGAGSSSASAATNTIDNRSDTPGTTTTCKSTSFNNLAMALGTGLAESMDDSTSDNNMASAAPGRIHTPDMYTRQSRHSVSRLAGGGGGFDYLNPGGTSHLLIPPVNSTYLDKLKGQQPQQQQLNAGGQTGSLQQASSSAGVGGGFDSNGSRRGSGLGNGSNNGLLSNGSSPLQQAMPPPTSIHQHQQDQLPPMRFTAAMMANAQSSGCSNAPNNFGNQAGAASAGTSPIMGPNNNNPHQLGQELSRSQLPPQQTINGGGLGDLGGNISANAFSRSNTNSSSTIGMTVVEPCSTSNSPAPQRGATMIGMTSDGLLYPLSQQQHGMLLKGGDGNTSQNQQQQGSNNFALPGGNIINFPPTGGRASAPPPQSPQTNGPFIPGGMTTMVMNNAAIRAYTASSLQMRVAELHQELGSGGGGGVGGPVQGGGGGAIALRSVPMATGTPIPIVLTPAPTPQPPHVAMRPPSRGGELRPPSRGTGASPDPLLNKQISRSNTPASALTSTPNPLPNGASATLVVMSSQQPPPLHPPHGTSLNAATAASSTIPSTPMDPEQQKRESSAAQELTPFLRDPSPSAKGGSSSSSLSSNSSGNNSMRGLAILFASTLHVPEVRSMCEAFGALESFRSDFGESRGVFFATYYDLRSAQLAAGELPKVLNKAGSAGNNGSPGRVQVKYCVPLNSSSATDESMLMLSNLPGSVDEQDLNQVLSSFGEVRAIHYQASISDVDEDGNELTSYLVEFYDVQDARQALLELEQTNPWGERTKIKVGTRSPTKRKQGKDLILLMSCWRQGVSAQSKAGEGSASRSKSQQSSQPQQEAGSVGNTVSPTPSPSPTQPSGGSQQQEPSSAPSGHVTHQQHTHQGHQTNDIHHSSSQPYYQYSTQSSALHQYQLVVGPDGQYSYAMIHPQIGMSHYGHPGQMVIDPHGALQQQQQLMYAPTVDQHYIHHNPHMNQQYHLQYNGVSQQQAANYGMPGMVPVDAAVPTPFIRMPSNDVNSSSLSSSSQSPGGSRVKMSVRTSQTGKSGGSLGSGSSGNNSGGAGNDDDANSNLALSINNVRSGQDRRSSLMVRNIPNKYTQQMLLAEFAAAGHGSDKMDFFYLPIDFKNKCNRGYAFVNFVDYKDIIPFFDEYNGRGWKRFNSDKICDITYARIQGKAAMLKRFENSALMEKDDEYRPKVFVSHGERKGQLENWMPSVGAGSR